MSAPEKLEQQARGTGNDLGPGHAHASARAGAAAHLDQPLGLQHAHGLAQCRPADPEMLHELGFIGQEIAFFELTVDDHATQRARDELGGFRRPDRGLARDRIGPDHRCQRGGSGHEIS